MTSLAKTYPAQRIAEILGATKIPDEVMPAQALAMIEHFGGRHPDAPSVSELDVYRCALALFMSGESSQEEHERFVFGYEPTADMNIHVEGGLTARDA